MSFLLDTSIVSAYLKGDRRVFNRFVQHGGGLAISAISVGELYSWVHRKKTRPAYREACGFLRCASMIGSRRSDGQSVRIP